MGASAMNCLLLRGLGREAGHWGEFYELLNKSNTFERVIALDLPGTGSEWQRNGLWRMDAIVEDLRSRIELEQPTVVCAISFGAMVAMRWTELYSEDFAAAVLINTSDARLSKPWQRLKPKALKEFMLIAKEKNTESKERRVLALTSYKTTDENSEIVSEWIDIAKERPVKLRTLLSQFSVAGKFKAPKEMNIPSLFFVSEADQIVHADCGRRLAEEYHSSVVVHPTAGHDMPLDDPKLVVENMTEFIKENFQKTRN